MTTTTNPRVRTMKIAMLNDAFRVTGQGGRYLMTCGVSDRGEEFIARAVHATRSFTTFTNDIDPRGEHDMGAFDLDGVELYWKIDYYDKAEQYGSEDPADPAQTTRVLTILLADEY